MPPKTIMLPKPTMTRVKEELDSKAMPPPPLPSLILQPELNALSTCLKKTVVNTGQIYRFYSDVKRLKIQKHASKPPGSLTATLGRDVERYDQLCDAIESRLLRAISVLQRDVARDEQKAREAEMVASAKRSRSRSTSPTPSTNAPMQTSPESSTQALPTPSSSPPIRTSTLPGRRQSTISLSSLNRPAFPLKLDLSAASLRLSAEEASFMSSGGLHSPVTLAPKSARPLDYPHDLMAALSASTSNNPPKVDIDLTLPETAQSITSVGSSADQPIEIDLDNMDLDIRMSELFGDSGDVQVEADGMEGLFSPVVPPPKIPTVSKDPDNFLEVLGVSEPPHEDIFASLTANETLPQAVSGTVPARSPGALLASLAGSSTDPVPQFDDLEFDMAFLNQEPTDISLTAVEDLFNVQDST